MARNLIEWAMGLPDDADRNNTNEYEMKDTETDKEYCARINAKNEQAKQNMANYKEAKRLGLVRNGIEYDEYLRSTGQATNSGSSQQLAPGVTDHGNGDYTDSYGRECDRHGNRY